MALQQLQGQMAILVKYFTRRFIMLKFIANLFGKKVETPVAPAPYKVETTPVETPAKVAKPKAEKKPPVKAKTARKPRAPKAPK